MSEEKARPIKDYRTRNWVCILYPTKEQLISLGSDYDGSDGYGSLPDNWRDILDEEHIKWIESPLHDKDINPDKTRKKPHWHILLLFDGKKSYEQIKELTDKLNSPIPKKCTTAKGTVRYMAHLDHADKYQYDKGAIIGHGGADVIEYLKPTGSTRYQLIGEMMDFVRDKDIIEMEDLLYYARTERFDDWFPLLCDNSAYIMGAMIKSHRHRVERSPEFNHETGEVIDNE